MPDLLTHYATARLAGLAMKKEEDRLILALGVIAPDIEMFIIKIALHGDSFHALLSHSLVGAFLYALVINFFFGDLKSLLLLYGGMIIHIFFDLFKYNLGKGVSQLFFPFDKSLYEFGLYYPTDIIYAIPFSLAAVIALEFYYHANNKKQVLGN